MVDQVQKVRSRSAKATIVSSGAGVVAVAQELLATDGSLQQDNLSFCAPDSLIKSRWREAVESPLVSSRIVTIIMHEAHCMCV